MHKYHGVLYCKHLFRFEWNARFKREALVHQHIVFVECMVGIRKINLYKYDVAIDGWAYREYVDAVKTLGIQFSRCVTFRGNSIATTISATFVLFSTHRAFLNRIRGKSLSTRAVEMAKHGRKVLRKPPTNKKKNQQIGNRTRGRGRTCALELLKLGIPLL